MTSLLDREPHTRGRFGPSPDEARMLLTVAFRPVGLLLAVVTAVVLVTLVSANSDLTGTFGALAATWLAVHQVPLGIAGATLSILPLLPTLVLVHAVSSAVARPLTDASTRRDIGWVVGAAIAGPLAMAAVMLAMIHDASTVIALSTPNALATFGWVILVHGIGAAIGCIRGTWPSLMRTVVLPPWLAASFAPAARAGAVLLAGGAVVVAASLVLSFSTLGTLLESGGGIGGALGLTAISVLYLPNIVVAASSVVTGSSAHVGAAMVSVTETTGGQLPAVPVLAVMPESSAQVWWPVMLVVPALAAVVLGRACARATTSLADAVRSAAAAAVCVSVAALLIGVVAGGSVGTFGHLGVDAPLLGVTTFAWCLVVGALTAAVTAWSMRRHDIHGWHEDSEAEERESDDSAGTSMLGEPAALPAAPDAAPTDTDIVEAETEAETTDTVETEDDAVEADVVDAEIVDLPDESAEPEKPGGTDTAP
ncbi:hypothetical protein HQ308_21805 [Rhodococcus sp. BP-241]|uniref:cell division protein PerM n=1 Tax=Rhodococcus sp. BP-241 TaxID=2739441 RepID=UPI001C9B2EE6|nr:DUF6350 family protein [Rhodococcus sp. BP-241]MBY6709430.1 hypothetical protein [Rhodococcus sp. BP-241]